MRNRLVVAIASLLLLASGSVAVVLADGAQGSASLAPTPLAVNAGLENSSGTARLQIGQGTVTVVVDLGGAELPTGTVLEGWLVDAGLLGGPGGTSVSDADEVYGVPFGSPEFDMMVENAPYALSTGVLKPLGNGRFQGRFRIKNNLTPYDAVVITLESDGNGENYDPRPGTPVLAGGITR